MTYSCTIQYSDGVNSTNATMHFTGGYDETYKSFELKLIDGTVTKNTPEGGKRTGSIKKSATLTITE